MHSTLVHRRTDARDEPASCRLVFLHDYGSCSKEALEICRSLGPEYTIFAPESPRPANPVEGRTLGISSRAGARSWFISNENRQIEPASFGDALTQLESFLLDLDEVESDETVPLVLFGEGQGGALALLLAAMHCDKVQGAIASDPWIPAWIDEIGILPTDLSNLQVLLIETGSEAAHFSAGRSAMLTQLTQSGALVSTDRVSEIRIAGSLVREWLARRIERSTCMECESTGVETLIV